MGSAVVHSEKFRGPFCVVFVCRQVVPNVLSEKSFHRFLPTAHQHRGEVPAQRENRVNPQQTKRSLTKIQSKRSLSYASSDWVGSSAVSRRWVMTDCTQVSDCQIASKVCRWKNGSWEEPLPLKLTSRVKHTQTHTDRGGQRAKGDKRGP